MPDDIAACAIECVVKRTQSAPIEKSAVIVGLHLNDVNREHGINFDQRRRYFKNMSTHRNQSRHGVSKDSELWAPTTEEGLARACGVPTEDPVHVLSQPMNNCVR